MRATMEALSEYGDHLAEDAARWTSAVAPIAEVLTATGRAMALYAAPHIARLSAMQDRIARSIDPYYGLARPAARTRVRQTGGALTAPGAARASCAAREPSGPETHDPPAHAPLAEQIAAALARAALPAPVEPMLPAAAHMNLPIAPWTWRTWGGWSWAVASSAQEAAKPKAMNAAPPNSEPPRTTQPNAATRARAERRPAKGTPRRRRRPRTEFTDRQQAVYEWRTHSKLSFVQIAELLTNDYPRKNRRPYTRQAAQGLHRRAVEVITRRRRDAEARLSLHRGA